MAVDARRRGLRIGKRLYEARRALAERLELRGIVFGGRMPGYARVKARIGGPEACLAALREGWLRDPGIGFQLGTGLPPIGVLRNNRTARTQSSQHSGEPT